jgi:phospholipid-binding lipoprotein MlaA
VITESFDNQARELGGVIVTDWRRTACTFASVLILFSTAPAPVSAQDESELANATDATRPDPPVPEASAPTTDSRIPGERIQPEHAEGAAIRDDSVVRSTAREPDEPEPYDPWEAFNSKMFEFNRRMDKHALKPVAKGWKTVVPVPAQTMIANVFDNLNVVPRVVNNVLQGNWNGAERELSRFLINSTVGAAGLFDPAKDVWHITKSPADFGQTLSKWGAGPGPYLVLPFMAPLTVRDGIGKLVDRAIDPLSYVVPLIPALGLTAGNRINERALNYELFADFDDAVIDAYSAVRSMYLQHREGMLNE